MLQFPNSPKNWAVPFTSARQRFYRGYFAGGIAVFIALLTIAASHVSAQNQSETIDYHHRLYIHPVPGMMSRLELVAPNDLSSGQVFFVIDGQLLVLPLLKSQDDLFTVEFPTPINSLAYRLQTVSSQGKASLSTVFSAAPRCEPLPASELDRTQTTQIERALALDERATLITSSIANIERLVGKN